MPRFTLHQEIAAGFAAIFCSAILLISSVGPGTSMGSATFI